MTFFLQDAPGLLEDIRTTVREGDGEALEFVAHRLKGLLAGFDAVEGVEYAHKLEQMGSDGNLVEADAALGQLQTRVDHLKQALEEFVASN